MLIYSFYPAAIVFHEFIVVIRDDIKMRKDH